MVAVTFIRVRVLTEEIARMTHYLTRFLSNRLMTVIKEHVQHTASFLLSAFITVKNDRVVALNHAFLNNLQFCLTIG